MTYTYVPPSPKLVRFLRALAGERQLAELGATGGERVATVDERLQARMLDKFDAMRLVDRLKASPYDQEGVAVGVGVYQRNGTIYVVRKNRTNQGLHARRLVEIGGRRLTEADTVVKIEFEYDRDALLQLRPEDRMTLEDAKPFVIKYGRCIACDTPLSDATSVERGIGPVCVKKFAPAKPAPQLSAESSDRLAELLAKLGA